EAEDKFLGPLTLKQFIFGAGAAFFGYLSFFAVIKGFAWALIIFMPPALLGAFMAVPWSKDQPTEIWVLAKIRFYFMTKKRIWNQSGVQELVKITAPKKIEKILTNNLSQGEVTSRLKALAETIDSRGWAVKHASLAEAQMQTENFVSDRLVTPVIPEPVSELTDQITDMYDLHEDNVAQGLQASTDAQHQRNIDKLNRLRAGESLDDVNKTQAPNFTPDVPAFDFPKSSSSTASNIDEQLLTQKLREKSETGKSHLHDRKTGTPGGGSSTTTDDPAIINLANNDDLDVATIARQANKNSGLDDGEVVISLR
ncbi:MAG: PrgI family protein, partial [Patescibacteria group bacterium]